MYGEESVSGSCGNSVLEGNWLDRPQGRRIVRLTVRNSCRPETCPITVRCRESWPCPKNGRLLDLPPQFRIAVRSQYHKRCRVLERLWSLNRRSTERLEQDERTQKQGLQSKDPRVSSTIKTEGLTWLVTVQMAACREGQIANPFDSSSCVIGPEIDMTDGCRRGSRSYPPPAAKPRQQLHLRGNEMRGNQPNYVLLATPRGSRNLRRL